MIFSPPPMFPTSFLNLKIGEKAIRKSIILMKWERDFQWEDEFGGSCRRRRLGSGADVRIKGILQKPENVSVTSCLH